MKRKMSVSALAIQLTAPAAILLFLAVGILQWLLFNPDPANGTGYPASFSTEIEGPITLLGYIGFGVLLLLLMLCSTSRKGDFSMTLNRLGLSCRSCAGMFGLIFAVWLLLYWIFQTAMMILLYSRYAATNTVFPMQLLLNCYDSNYLHHLIPLQDVWGYARNFLLAVSFGMAASCTACHIRRTGHLMLVFLPYLWLVVCHILMRQALASRTEDIMLSVFALLITAGTFYLAGKGEPK